MIPLQSYEGFFCLLKYLGDKKVIQSEKTLSLHFNFYGTVKNVEYFYQRN